MQLNLYWTFNLHIQYRYCKLRVFINKTFIKCYCKYYYNICLFLNNLVAIMLKYSVPDNKIGRLNKFEFFDLLNRGKDPQFDVFAETACLIANCPSSLIAIMESETQTIQSCIGLEIDSMDRENMVCQYSIANGEVAIINETLLDNRSRPDPLILAAGIRFYARIPFVDDESFELGTVCLIDYKPRAIIESQITTLKKFEILTEKYINMDMLNEQIGGDDYFKEIFLNLLINELNQTKNDIDTAAAIKNTGDAKMILHKLKGTAGFFSLSECALKWEKKADDNMDFSAMKKEIIEEITIGLNIIKSLIKYNQKLC